MLARSAPRFDYLRQVWGLRYFWFSLVKTDLTNRYRRSFLGVGWSLVRPLVMTAVFSFVFSRLFARPADDYVAFLLMGLTLWQFLSESILLGCESFTRAGPYIRQQPVPLAIFPLRTVLSAGFHALVGFGVAVVVAGCYRGPPGLRALAAVAGGLSLLFLLAWFLAILGGVFRCHFPDTPHLVEVGMQILMYLTPILYPLDGVRGWGGLSLVIRLNPFTWVVEMVRGPLLGGGQPSGVIFGINLLIVSAAGLLAVVTLRRLERTLVFWV